MSTAFSSRSAQTILQALRQGQEVALIDLRDEAQFASGHPLFAANIAFSRLEIEIGDRVPRLSAPVTLYDNGEGLTQLAAHRLQQLGYSDVALLEGNLDGWRQAGGELFIDVNSPSKAFGELVDSRNHTPSLTAEEVDALLKGKQDVVVLDSRRFDEYQTMSIPGAISVPGGELALRIKDLAPSAQTTVIVNCAGRTRSIIGTQSLINTGISNPVYALRNGTIGWTLAGQPLEHGQSRRYGALSDDGRQQARLAARRLADRAGVARIDVATLARWQQDETRTSYLFDVRDPAEYEAGHLPASRPVPGGQLVQETDHYASVRGARVVLVDNEGVRADMTASWLAQMGWEVAVLDGLSPTALSESGQWKPRAVAPSGLEEVAIQELADWLQQGGTRIIDFTASASFVQQHIPGAAWLTRAALLADPSLLPAAERYVVTCGSSLLARFAWQDVASLTDKPVYVLSGGDSAWFSAGYPRQTGEEGLLIARQDRYRRPYEGLDNSLQAMQAYLDWEYGLVAQLERDGTHGFFVLASD